MSLSARVPSTAVTNYFIPTIYSNRVVDAIKSTLVAWDSIDGSWEKGMTKGNILNIPKTNTVVATEVVVGTKASALNPLNTTGVQLTINQWYEAPVDIDTMTARQKGANVEDIAVKEAAYAIKVLMDTSVCNLFSSLGGFSTSGYGTDGQTLDDDLLLYLKETLDEADVPMDGDRTLIIDPSALSDMLKVDKFIAAQYIKQGAVSNGKIGNTPIYGCEVRVTNNLTAATTGAYAAMLHKKAIGAAAQIEKSWRKDFEELHNVRYQSEALWGVVEVMDTFGIPFFTRKK